MHFARFPLLVVALLGLLVVPAVFACEFCSAPSLTLTEQLDQADAAVLVKWVSATKAKLRSEEDVDTTDNFASTSYEIVQLVKNTNGSLKKGGEVVLPQYRAGKPGDLALLLGVQGTSLEWGTPIEVTEASFKYVSNAPAPKDPTTKRLEYFLGYLEFPDDLVANDAYGEFANAPYEEIKKLKDKMPRERIRQWVADPETAVTRLGLYGLLLGLAGNEEDAKLMAERITKPTEDFRLGIDGIMAGYLLLTGNEGLKIIEESKLRPGTKVPFSETYAAMQAVRFHWSNGNGRIEKERLKQTMRMLLDRPELADLVIADLARWKDWSVQDRLMKLYDQEGYDIPSIKRAIVRYLLTCSKDTTKDKEENPPAHVAQAKKHLDALREKDPLTVKQAERFFFLN